MTAAVFLAVFLALALSRVVGWAFVQTIWLPLTRSGAARKVVPDESGRSAVRSQDEMGSAEQWLCRAALDIPSMSDPRYFQAVVRLSVAALEYRRSLGEALDRHFAHMGEAAVLEPGSGSAVLEPRDEAASALRDVSSGGIKCALDAATRYALYEYAAILYDEEAARRNRLSEAVMAGVDALSQRRPLSRACRAALEEYASGAWRPAQEPSSALVTAVRALLAAVDEIRGLKGSMS